MLLTLAIWIYAGLLCGVYGLFAVQACVKIFRYPNDLLPHPSLVLLAGLSFLAAVCGYLTLVLPFNEWVHVILTAGALAIILTHKNLYTDYAADYWQRIRGVNPLVAVVFAVLFCVVLLKTVEPAHNSDTGFYHMQAVEWITRYRAVPGLANLFDRLGFNSSWFPLSALFSFSFIAPVGYHVLNGFIFLLVLTFALSYAATLPNHPVSASGLFSLGFLFLARRLFSWELSSPGTDLPVALLICAVFLLGLRKLEREECRVLDFTTLALLGFSLTALTIKTSALPLLVLPAYCLWTARDTINPSKWAVLICLTGLIVGGWIARNVVLSGYLVYPFPEIDLFNVPWKVPVVYAAETRDWIVSWARLPGEEMSAVLALPISDWAPQWFAAQSLLDKVLLLAAGLSAAGYGLTRWLDKNNLWYVKGDWILWVTGCLGIVYWFLTAPDMRFGYGYLGAVICWFAAAAARRGLAVVPKISGVLISLILIGFAGYQAVSLVKWVRSEPTRSYLVYPATDPTPAVVERSLGNFSVKMPAEGNQCWSTEVPCTPIHNPEVNLLGDGYQDGFWNPHQQTVQ